MLHAPEHTGPPLAGGDVVHVTIEHRDRQRRLGNEETKILVRAAEARVGAFELLGTLRDASLQIRIRLAQRGLRTSRSGEVSPDEHVRDDRDTQRE